GSKLTAKVVQTHGWVLPGDGKQRFAVCWNGLVYPVLAVGDLCDVAKDVEQQLKPPPDDNEKFQRGFYTRGFSVPEAVSTGYETPLIVNAAMLLRLGKADLADKVFKAANESPFPGNTEPPPDTGKIYSRLAGMWLCSWYNRAICAWMRGDD